MNEGLDYLLNKVVFPELVFFDGHNPLADMIGYWTQSKWYHVGIGWGKGEIFDARMKKGVDLHSIGDFAKDSWEVLSPIRIFTPKELEDMRECWLSEKGKKYDLQSIWSFIFRTKREKDLKRFCSELVCPCFRERDYPLVARIDPESVWPGLLYHSVRLYSKAKYNRPKDRLTVFNA